MRSIFVFALLLPLAGCCVKNAGEVKNDPVSVTTMTVRHGYQEAITIVRNAVSMEDGVNLACTQYPEQGYAECVRTGINGATSVVTARFIDGTRSELTFYERSFICPWRRNITAARKHLVAETP